MKRFIVLVRFWLLACAACAAAVAFSFAELDVAATRRFWWVGHHLSSLNTAFGAAVILTLESAVVLSLMLARLMRGHLPRFAEALVIACLASICAYTINDQVLKRCFGVQPPAAVLAGARHALHFLKGTAACSFPSGHMALAGAFAGVFMRLYRASVRPLSALLLVAAVLLVVGGWHFISDVIAGAFLGVSAGILAGEGWAVHASALPSSSK